MGDNMDSRRFLAGRVIPSAGYRWMWKSVLFAIERFISMRESNWGKSVLFAFSLGFA